MALDNYVTVAERLIQAQEQIQTVVSEPPIMLTDVMGFIRITVALKDGRSATGTASFRLDLAGNRAQATNPLEDCETSALGRALGFLGYGASKGIASSEEMQEAQRRTIPSPNGNGNPSSELASDKQKKMLFAIWKNEGFDGDLKTWIGDTFKCGVDELTKKQASQAIETLQPKAVSNN